MDVRWTSAIAAVIVACLLAGCSDGEPTLEAGSEVVYDHVKELKDMRGNPAGGVLYPKRETAKTDGQAREVAGVQQYLMDFTAEIEAGTSLVLSAGGRGGLLVATGPDRDFLKATPGSIVIDKPGERVLVTGSVGF